MSQQIPIVIHPKFWPLWQAPHSFANIYGGRGGMKCLAIGTKVIMADGRRKAVEEVLQGEHVMGPDSEPRLVVALSKGSGPLYRVSQTSAMEYVVNETHLLSLKKSTSCAKDVRIPPSGIPRSPRGRYPNEPAVVQIAAKDYLSKSERWKANFRGYRVGVLKFQPQPIDINPYFLGLWLGDGHSYSLRLFNEDQEVIDWCAEYAASVGANYKDSQESGRCRRVEFSIPGPRRTNRLWAPFKTYGIAKNKHIPQAYLANSEEVRLAVLAGLMDTDGHYRANRRGFVIELVSEKLASDVKFLADSLGFRTSIKGKRTQCGNNGVSGSAFRISISGSVWRIPTLVKRKQAPREEFRPNKDNMLSMVSVAPIGSGEWAGFEVDGDHLFLLEDGTVTHNSEQVHRVALQEAVTIPMRVCCCRETMSSIADSSHKLLEDAIYEYGMAKSQNGPYEIQESRIFRRDGDQIASEFIFIGIREDVRNNKSLKGINLTIVEEAAKVSQDSWDVLIPTVMGREEGSRLWAIWNPELTTDATWKMFMQDPPTGTIHIHTNYLENPWLTDTMRVVAEDCKRKDPKKYEHIWMGKPITEVEGAIYADELKELDASASTRITEVPYDRTKPVETAWDLGFGDPTCVWFVQPYGGFWNLIDYYQDDGKDISHYAIMLQNKGYMYGTHWLPHDGVDNIVHQRLAGAGADLSMSIPSLLAKAGLRVAVTPKLLKDTTINALRTIFSVLRFDATRCVDGLQALRHYQWDKVPDSNGTIKPGTRKPLHNWASHAPEALQNMAVSVKQPGLGMMPKIPKRRQAANEYGYMG